MNNKLIEKLNKFNMDSTKGIYISEILQINKDTIMLYSNIITDFYWNHIQMNSICGKEDFENRWSASRKIMLNRNRKPAIFVLPIFNIYNNRDEYFSKNFKIVSQDLWQIYDNFENVENIKTNCTLRIRLEEAKDFDLYAKINFKGFNTRDSQDPYGGNYDPLYKKAFSRYKNTNTGYNQNFFFIHANNTLVGVVNIIYDNEIIGFHGLTVLKKYRNQGIGKEVIKQLLIFAKDKKIKIAFLQTEKGYYPEKLYNKLGFKDLCIGYVYVEK